MARRGKVYGWTISLWEEPDTCPTLFRHVSDWKESQMIPTATGGGLWTAMMQASWLPYPFRRWMRWSPLHDQYGDMWSLCHYWSNFEIADLDFFRSRQYQGLFEYLDAKGGFYKERVSLWSLLSWSLKVPPCITVFPSGLLPPSPDPFLSPEQRGERSSKIQEY